MDGDLRRIFATSLPTAQWTPIESGMTANGIPDCEYCFPGGGQGWVEAKKISGWVVTLRPAQIGWLVRRARMGGRAFVAIRKDDTLWLRPGSEAKELREVGLRGCPGWGGGPGRWPWDEIESQLRGFTDPADHHYERKGTDKKTGWPEPWRGS